MPITSSAKKALRVSMRKRIVNLQTKAKIDEPVKKFRKLVAEKNKKDAAALIPVIYQALDKAAKSGLIKKNTAARKKSRFTAMLKKVV